MTITAAVDGSALGNPGPAGWAWVVSEDCWDAGGWEYGTNNLGELTAILEVLRATQEAGLADEPLLLLADSQYAINVVTKWRHGWKARGWVKADKKPIKNCELIQQIDRAIDGRNVTFEWVKGHAGHPLNELADEKARACAQAYRDKLTPASGPKFSHSGAVPVGKAEGTPLDGQDTGGLTQAPTCDEDGVRSAQATFIRAWMSADTEVLSSLEGHDCHRVWADGRVTDTLAGPVPSDLTVGRMSVRRIGPDAWLVCHRLLWPSGRSFESTVWAATTNLRIIHHQSTLLP